MIKNILRHIHQPQAFFITTSIDTFYVFEPSKNQTREIHQENNLKNLKQKLAQLENQLVQIFPFENILKYLLRRFLLLSLLVSVSVICESMKLIINK
jgi:hypothetical protein